MAFVVVVSLLLSRAWIVWHHHGGVDRVAIARSSCAERAVLHNAAGHWSARLNVLLLLVVVVS